MLNRLSARFRLILLLSISATLILITAVLGYLLYTYPILTLGTSFGPPVSWSGLPTPVVVHADWRSYSYAGEINDLTLHSGLLWAGTEGGMMVWDATTGNGRKFTAENGLAANRVSSVAVGIDGALWFGTSGGVSRFDGRSWQTYTTADGLAANQINDLLILPNGRLIAATERGLNSYNGRRWQTGTALLSLPPEGAIRVLAAAQGNQFWAAGDGGLGFYDGRSWRLFTLADGLPDTDIQQLVTTADGALWLQTPLGITRYDGSRWDSFLYGVDIPPGTQLVGANGINVHLATATALLQLDPAGLSTELALPPALVTTTHIDGAGQLWAGTDTDAYRLQSGTAWQPFVAQSDLPSNQISGLLQTNSGIWGSTENGALRFSGGGWQIYGSANGLPSNYVSGLATTPTGDVWAAFDKATLGLSRFRADTWETTVCELNAPPSRVVHDGLEAADGTIWLATDSGIAHLENGRWQIFTTIAGLPANDVRQLLSDQAGHIWAGTAAGLARFDGSSWTRISDAPINQLVQPPNGTIWVLDERDALFRAEGEHLRSVEHPATLPVQGIAATETAVFLATSGGIWQGQNGEWTLFDGRDGLPYDNVTALTVDGDGKVWAATFSDESLSEYVWFDGQQWQPHPNRNPDEEVLAGNVVNAILPLENGDVWFATDNGLTLRQPNGRWQSVGLEQGLPAREVRDLAFAYGAVWAATAGGVVQLTDSGWEEVRLANGMKRIPTSLMTVGPDGRLWISPDDFSEGLHIYDGERWTLLETVPNGAIITGLTFDEQGRPWVAGGAPDDEQLLWGYYDGLSWVWRFDGIQPALFFEFAEDGRLWAGLRAGGIKVYEVGGPELLIEVASYATPQTPESILLREDGAVTVGADGRLFHFDGISWVDAEETIDGAEHLFDIATDANGQLWVGTEQGVAQRQPDERWQPYYAHPFSPRWWGAPTSLTTGEDNALIIGTLSGGVGLYTGRTYGGGAPRDWSKERVAISSSFLAADGSLWVTSEGGGAARLRPTGGWELFVPDLWLTAPVQTFSVVADEEQTTAWLGTAEGIVALTGLENGRCQFAHARPELNGQVSLPVADGASVWMGTARSGAIRLDAAGTAVESNWPDSPVSAMAAAPDGGAWFVNPRQPWLTRLIAGNYQRIPLAQGFIDATAIQNMTIAPNRTVWLGTQDGAMSLSGGQWQTLRSATGLADNDVQQVLAQPDGSVWFATRGGISLYRP